MASPDIVFIANAPSIQTAIIVCSPTLPACLVDQHIAAVVSGRPKQFRRISASLESHQAHDCEHHLAREHHRAPRLDGPGLLRRRLGRSCRLAGHPHRVIPHVSVLNQSRPHTVLLINRIAEQVLHIVFSTRPDQLLELHLGCKGLANPLQVQLTIVIIQSLIVVLFLLVKVY